MTAQIAICPKLWTEDIYIWYCAQIVVYGLKLIITKVGGPKIYKTLRMGPPCSKKLKRMV
jgi:hypothetical protein